MTDPVLSSPRDGGGRIARIRLHPVLHRMPDDHAYGMARGLTAIRGATIVEVETRDGIAGFGEAWGPPEFTAGYAAFVERLWIGARLTDHAALFARVLGGSYHLGVTNALTALLSGVDIAIHDALGKSLGLPVHALLGGRARDSITCYASGGYFTADPARGLAAQVERFRGFPACKLKIGHGPADDRARVALVREALGDDTVIFADANGNYTRDLALRSMEAVADLRIGFYEEPLPPGDVEGYRALLARAPIPVAAGEALYTAAAFDAMLSPRALDVAQPDLALCGGLSQGRLVSQLCGLRHARLSPHVWGTGLGLAAAVHLVAAHSPYPATTHEPEPPWVEYDVAENPLRDGILYNPLVPERGIIAVPETPGLGVEVDRDALARFGAA